MRGPGLTATAAVPVTTSSRSASALARVSMPSRYATQRSPAPPTASSSAAIGPIAERSGSQPKKVPDIGCNSRSYRSRW
nr:MULTISPECIES: hypothetical protein [unclassified Streptomyces]